jgi:hypothetical protein
MPADSYRDAQVGIRARLTDLEQRLREREAEVTDTFWASLDDHVRERLADLREGLGFIASTSLEDLARAEASLAAYVEELDRLIAMLPALEEEWLEIPEDVGDPPTHDDERGFIDDASLQEFKKTFRTAVRDRNRDAEIIVDGTASCVARFRSRDVPFSLRATALPNGNGGVGDVVMQLFTSVARATPALFVRHESLFAAFGKAIGLKHEIEVGDTSFDGLFLIQGSRQAVERFLVPNVRARLMTLARFDVPTLEVDPKSRIASLIWCFEPAATALDAAIGILSFIRETQSEVCFRKAS